MSLPSDCSSPFPDTELLSFLSGLLPISGHFCITALPVFSHSLRKGSYCPRLPTFLWRVPVRGKFTSPDTLIYVGRKDSECWFCGLRLWVSLCPAPVNSSTIQFGPSVLVSPSGLFTLCPSFYTYGAASRSLFSHLGVLHQFVFSHPGVSCGLMFCFVS